MRYKLTLEYDGTGLIGWQKNKDGDSVQSLLSAAIYKFCGQDVDVVGAGRTDSGVHALAAVCHFDIDTEHDAETVKKAINFYLKEMGTGIVVLNAEKVSDDFHARFDAKMRYYRYIILNRAARPVMDKNKVYWIPKNLDTEKMAQHAQKFMGERDWSSFRAAECQAKSPIKSLNSISVETTDMSYGGTSEMHGQYIIINVSARSFLHHQIRN
ncbi:MAG: tRNA pseudouridine(38-40) synthase TruA, partial [Alphaproteobacteria bacterium]|nr:tRNA pseudouridine(38-40) synthase TruA [Alphaproteobacteria bacterium]